MCVLAQMKMHRLLVGGEQQTTSIFMAQKKQQKKIRERILPQYVFTVLLMEKLKQQKKNCTESANKL